MAVHLPRHSLVTPLLGVYLALVLLVLAAGISVSLIGQQQLRAGIQSADLALAQAIALDTDDRLRLAHDAMTALSSLEPVRQGDSDAIGNAFKAFKAARPDVDRVYWLNSDGLMQISEPFDVRTLGTDYSKQSIFLRARQHANAFVEAGVVDLTTYRPVAIIVQPIYSPEGKFVGALAANLSLDDLSVPLKTIVADQAKQLTPLRIHVLDANGILIASAQRERLLQNMRDELPVAAHALQGAVGHLWAADWRGESWLYSAAPIPTMHWAVVVQRPSEQALRPIGNFNNWLLGAAILFGLVGLLFWQALSLRIIRPLQLLSAQHREQAQSLTTPNATVQISNVALIQRSDEIGDLAQSLARLESDVNARLQELHELLRASSSVVGTLDPRTVVISIIQAAQQLVGAQAAAVLVPDEQDRLRVLASEGRSRRFDNEVNVPLDDIESPSAQALREGKPVQLLAGKDANFSQLAFDEGFRSVLAVPIISRHAGAVVLVVHRNRLQAFSTNEVDLLLTLANYATLAWEHAKLYERSDIRLRTEQQRLAAVMRSMDEGLVFADENDHVIYANRAASEIVGIGVATLEQAHLSRVQNALRQRAENTAIFDKQYAQLKSNLETQINLVAPTLANIQTLSLRSFVVRAADESVIGNGLLIRDVTREQEMDRFKSALLAAVGHEVRTPLAAIKGYASSLLQDDVTWSPSEHRHFAQTIDHEADRLAQVVSNLLDLSRSEAGLLLLNQRDWCVGELVERGIERANLARKNVQLHFSDDLPSVNVDGPRIEIVFANLLANAAAYGNGLIRISAGLALNAVGVPPQGVAYSSDDVLIEVQDDGDGIAPEELPHIFERFYRASSGMQRRAGGSGLGLAICRAFVEAHGGRVWARSNCNGTIIAFTLPSREWPAPSELLERIATTIG